MVSRLRRDRDPLDLEIVEAASAGAWGAIKENNGRDLESDEELEAALRRELMEIAGVSVSEPEALRDILVADLLDRVGQWDGE